MYYVYPALFMPKTGGGYLVRVPDLSGCITSGESLKEALHMAKDAISVYLCSVEDHNDSIPEPSDPHIITLDAQDAFVTLIEVDTAQYRSETDNRTVRRNVSLPAWLDKKAAQARINVSQLLQDALRERLGV